MKPGDFYVGVLDLFAIFLPGIVAFALLEPRTGILQFPSMTDNSTKSVVGFLVVLAAAYILGHMIYLVGSYIDGIYDYVRKKWDPYDDQSPYQHATLIRNGMISESERESINTYQWSRSVLLTNFPAGASDVHRLDADSKFFRSLLVICILVTCVVAYEKQYLAALMVLLLVIPFFARYYERRLKSTTQAYIHIITLHRLGKINAAVKTNRIKHRLKRV